MSVAGAEPAARPGRYWRQAARRLAAQPMTLAALAVLLVVFLLGALAPELAPQRWNDLDLSERWRNHPPTLDGWTHLLGTDNIGRSVLVRTLWGLHYTEISAFPGALLATVLGVAVGGVAGLRGGWVDAVLMRVADLVTTPPVVVVMIAAFFYLEPLTVAKATLIFGLYLWAFVSRAIRARVVSLGAEEFVDAARALGASDAWIFFRHVLPNAIGAVLVAGTSTVGQIVLVEATAEFFGFGVASIVHPTLGNLIAEATSTGIGGYNQLGLGWWDWTAPAVVLVLVLVCVNLVGDGLAEALDPRARRR